MLSHHFDRKMIEFVGVERIRPFAADLPIFNGSTAIASNQETGQDILRFIGSASRIPSSATEKLV
jgi:hypothetical protein